MDLNLNNYSLHDLLRLFHLPENFNESELKEARKKVVAVHPDKSGLDKSYFIFFHKAYSLLNTVHKFKQRAHANMAETHSFSDIMADMEDSDKRMLAETFTSNNKFNEEFNTLFESLYIKDDEGYGDWLKSSEDLDTSYENRKQQSRSIVVSNIEAANTPYYSDLKNVYTVDSVIGVSEADYKQSYKTIEELKAIRAQGITPLQREEAERMIAFDQERESKDATDRAFKLLQQEEMNQQQQKTFWSKLLRLH